MKSTASERLHRPRLKVYPGEPLDSMVRRRAMPSCRFRDAATESVGSCLRLYPIVDSETRRLKVFGALVSTVKWSSWAARWQLGVTLGPARAAHAAGGGHNRAAADPAAVPLGAARHPPRSPGPHNLFLRPEKYLLLKIPVGNMIIFVHLCTSLYVFVLGPGDILGGPACGFARAGTSSRPSSLQIAPDSDEETFSATIQPP